MGLRASPTIGNGGQLEIKLSHGTNDSINLEYVTPIKTLNTTVQWSFLVGDHIDVLEDDTP